MDSRKNIFDYLELVFTIFGISIAVVNVFCLIFGDDAQAISTMFSLGSAGLSVATIGDFLLLSAIIALLKIVFFTDRVIKKMPVPGRAACMVMAMLAVTAVFIVCCGWFPADMWKAWGMFFAGFLVSFAVSTGVGIIKEKAENKKMQEALIKMKQSDVFKNE